MEIFEKIIQYIVDLVKYIISAAFGIAGDEEPTE